MFCVTVYEDISLTNFFINKLLVNLLLTIKQKLSDTVLYKLLKIIKMELMEMKTFEDYINDFVIDLNWKKLLLLCENVTLEEKRRFSWVWPTEKTLQLFEIYLKNAHIESILSIGCGTGLLEWIVQQSCGINVYGLELDKSWWLSRYSPKTFITLNFTESDINSELLLKCVQMSENHSSKTNNQWNFALMFCYFNNGEAFRNYVKYFQGEFIIIIGPKNGVGIHTDPLPFSPIFYSSDIDRNSIIWQLEYSIQIENSYNYIVIYKRLFKKK